MTYHEKGKGVKMKGVVGDKVLLKERGKNRDIKYYVQVEILYFNLMDLY